MNLKPCPNPECGSEDVITTEQLIDQIISIHGDSRSAIAYLIGRVDSSERRLNEVNIAIGKPKDRTTVEWLSHEQQKTDS